MNLSFMIGIILTIRSPYVQDLLVIDGMSFTIFSNDILRHILFTVGEVSTDTAPAPFSEEHLR
jgi:hypothetical protein